jgi:ferrochelatase
MASAPLDAVLLLAFGGPTGRDEIRPYLDNVLRGRPIPRERYEEVVAHYEAFDGVSPLKRLTLLQAEGLRDELRRKGPDLPVYVGMRHWEPFITDTLTEMSVRKHHRALGVILAAHPSPASRDSYHSAVDAARAACGASAPQVDYVEEWFEHPLFTAAITVRVRAAFAAIPEERRAAAEFICTAHSIPVAMSEVSGYDRSLRRTADLVARDLGINSWRLAYQSRSGAPTEAWLEPDITDELRAARSRGALDVVVAPIGFVSDHVEVLYDLDVQARGLATELGLGYSRAATVGDHPAFLRMLAAIVHNASSSSS